MSTHFDKRKFYIHTDKLDVRLGDEPAYVIALGFDGTGEAGIAPLLDGEFDSEQMGYHLPPALYLVIPGDTLQRAEPDDWHDVSDAGERDKLDMGCRVVWLLENLQEWLDVNATAVLNGDTMECNLLELPTDKDKEA